jgi:capsular exopolysaccharide synthesis family protein
VLPVSRETFRRNRIVAMEEMSPLADQFKLLRTHLFHRTRPTGLNAVQITGFSAGEGKSLVAVNLAISIARDARQTTLLVDVDFRNPSIHALFGLSPETAGLKQHFLDGRPLEDLLISPGIDKLTVLPAGGRIPHSTELIGSPAMETLVLELKERYPDRYVIFDTPPVTDCPDPLVFSEYVDAMILVARADHTRSDAVKAAMDLVPRQKVLGIVLNDAQTDV